jgi:hypothetical protein
MTQRDPKRWPLESGHLWRPLARPGSTLEAMGASSMRQQDPRREHSWVRQYVSHLDCRVRYHRDTMADVLDDSDVMGNKEVRESPLPL